MFASPSSAILSKASVDVMGWVVLKLTDGSFFFIARGGLGSWDYCYEVKKGAAPTVWENPGVIFGLVPGATDFLIGNLMDLIGNIFLDPSDEFYEASLC